MPSVADREKRLAELRKEVTQRGFDRHAFRLDSISELHPELQSPAVTALTEREPIETILAFPPQLQRGWQYVPKQALLFTASGVTHLLASTLPDQEPQVTYLKTSDLIYLKVTLLLLYGFLEIVVKGPDSPSRLSMEFNTVDWYCLSPPLRRLLQSPKAVLPGPVNKAAAATTGQRTFQKLPLKFSNGVKIYGLLPGEELEELSFQAGAWKPWLYFFRQPLSADTLLLLTSHYLVVMQEELEVKQGWILTYIPRSGIVGIKNQPCGLCNELSLQLKREKQSVDYKLILESEAAEAWHGQWVQHGGRWDDLPPQQV